MNTEETIKIVKTAYEQLVASIPSNVYMSWGVTQVARTTYRGMPTLVLCVNGFLHQGPVFISYNANTDLYEIATAKNHTQKVEEIRRVVDVYCDQLGSVVDKLVEKDCSQEEYEKMVDKSLKS